VRQEQGVTFSQKVGVQLLLSFPTRPFSFPPLPPPLEVGPLIELGGLGKCCKLPQRGPGRAPTAHVFLRNFSSKDGLLYRLKLAVQFPHFHFQGVRGVPLVPAEITPMGRNDVRNL